MMDLIAEARLTRRNALGNPLRWPPGLRSSASSIGDGWKLRRRRAAKLRAEREPRDLKTPCILTNGSMFCLFFRGPGERSRQRQPGTSKIRDVFRGASTASFFAPRSSDRLLVHGAHGGRH